jgi:redox-sensitive bicupin YhaK (pirin superfamily)
MTSADEDEFPVGWHPHRGMDILTYIVQGQGRHADSLGNRCTFESPGMQWIRSALYQ